MTLELIEMIISIGKHIINNRMIFRKKFLSKIKNIKIPKLKRINAILSPDKKIITYIEMKNKL